MANFRIFDGKQRRPLLLFGLLEWTSFAAFAHYATRQVAPADIVKLTGKSADYEQIMELEMVKYAHRVTPSLKVVSDILSKVDQTGVPVASLVGEGSEAPFRARAVAYMKKIGILA